jgi:MFS family permease
MPLYGRLGDDLGIRRMMLLGAGVFLTGTTVSALSQSLPLLLLGRFIQGLGASGMVPLAIAMISRVFPVETRGRALGQWNSVGPLAGMTGTLLGGVIIDTLGWRSTFFMPLLAGFVAVYMVRRTVRSPTHDMQSDALRDFDWLGVLLLSATLTALLFYITSRPITGRPSLTDWRLLLATVVLLATFVWHERRLTTTAPFIDLAILTDGAYRKACIAAATRMFVMSGSAFLIPLFLADIKGLNATATGLIFMLRAAALFPTMYVGGRVTDRWGSRLPITLGLSVQAASIGLLILSGPGEGLVWVVVGLIITGLGAGVALPALHHAAMSGQEGERGGAAAGLYSMIRFWGMMLGTALAGVLLQYLLDQGLVPLVSYRLAYVSTIIVGLIGVAIAFTLPGKQKNDPA